MATDPARARVRAVNLSGCARLRNCLMRDSRKRTVFVAAARRSGQAVLVQWKGRLRTKRRYAMSKAGIGELKSL